jgi:hypothetical protein
MRDSAAMRTIAVLTMLFLPGTAVAVSFFSQTLCYDTLPICFRRLPFPNAHHIPPHPITPLGLPKKSARSKQSLTPAPPLVLLQHDDVQLDAQQLRLRLRLRGRRRRVELHLDLLRASGPADGAGAGRMVVLAASVGKSNA